MLKLDPMDVAVHIFFQLINVSIATHIGGNHQISILSIAIYFIYKFLPHLDPPRQDLLSENTHTSCQLLLRWEHSYLTICAPAISGANTHAGMHPTNTVPLLLPTSVFQS